MIGGPLFMLQWKGTICKCFESREDGEARLALAHLDGLTVKWHRKGLGKKIQGMMSSWFGGSSSKNSSDDGNVESKLYLKDTEEKGPELQIKPQQQTSTSEDGEIRMKQSAGFMKSIPLKQIDRILLDDQIIVLQTTKGEDGTKTQDLARIEVMGDDPTETKEALKRIQEWNVRRLEALPEEEREMDEVDGIQRRARNAAHFAKREVELQKTKRDREKRKAALGVQGMKYTALAMANRMD